MKRSCYIMKTFSAFDRNRILNDMKAEQLDLLVIGGGITGAGISLDATTRGLKSGLVEMQDFGAGTSSRSTKLVHGGLRYLKQFEVRMVAEVGKERAIVYENGPHVTTPEWMMLPFHKGGTFGPFTTNIGLRVYDFLAGVKKGERREMLSPEEAVEKEPLIKKEQLKGAGYYVEYKTDDARLTIEVMKKAVEHGAYAVNYAQAIDYIYDTEGQINGVVVRDNISGETYHIHAKKIINACGPWVDDLREIDGSKQGKTLSLTKGIHLVFSKSDFPLKQAIYFDAPDGRMIFAIPRNDKTYVGTTDTRFSGDLKHPHVTVEDRDYLLDAIHANFPSVEVNKDNVESSWAGVRPLIAEDGKDPDEISRKDEIFISDSGLISMAGGKLTGYRKMAEQAVDTVTEQLKAEEGIIYSSSNTEHLPISGGETGGSKGYHAFKKKKMNEGARLGLGEKQTELLLQKYGTNIDSIFDYYTQDHPEHMDPLVFAELQYGIFNEMVLKPTDFFIRRTGALYFDIHWVKKHKESVFDYLADQFSWDANEKTKNRNELEKLILEATTPVTSNE